MFGLGMVLLLAPASNAAPQDSKTEALVIRRYGSSPNEAIESGDGLPPAIAEYSWKLRRLPVQECSRNRFRAASPTRNSVTLEVKPLDPAAHKIDPGADTIDGRAALGHDGLRSFFSPRMPPSTYVSKIKVEIGGRTLRPPRSDSVFMLNPQTSQAQFGCLLRAYWEPTEKVLILGITGGEGAGYYRTLLFFNSHGFAGQYARDASREFRPVSRASFKPNMSPKEYITFDKAPPW